MSTEPKGPEQPRVGNLENILGTGDSQDRYEKIASLRHDELAPFAADFCGEGSEPRTVAAFKKIIWIIGPEAFRSELSAFVGECAAGEEPRNRGATFNARLKRRVEAKAKQ